MAESDYAHRRTTCHHYAKTSVIGRFYFALRVSSEAYVSASCSIQFSFDLSKVSFNKIICRITFNALLIIE